MFLLEFACKSFVVALTKLELSENKNNEVSEGGGGAENGSGDIRYGNFERWTISIPSAIPGPQGRL
jgi:hypothetical protein